MSAHSQSAVLAMKLSQSIEEEDCVVVVTQRTIPFDNSLTALLEIKRNEGFMILKIKLYVLQVLLGTNKVLYIIY